MKSQSLGVWLAARRLVAIDGSCLDVAGHSGQRVVLWPP